MSSHFDDFRKKLMGISLGDRSREGDWGKLREEF
jgi:hypothetical protein